MDTSPKDSPPDHEEVLHTFTILEIHNAPDNTSSFELITFLDAAVAHSVTQYDYNQMELANRDNILRLLVRDATPQEDTNYYDMASELLSSDLLRDHECLTPRCLPLRRQGLAQMVPGHYSSHHPPPTQGACILLGTSSMRKKEIKRIPTIFHLSLRRVP